MIYSIENGELFFSQSQLLKLHKNIETLFEIIKNNWNVYAR